MKGHDRRKKFSFQPCCSFWMLLSVSAQISFRGGRIVHNTVPVLYWLYLAVLLWSSEHSMAIQEPTANTGLLLKGTEWRHLSFFCSVSVMHKVEARFGLSDKAPCSGSFWVRSYFSPPPSPAPSWVLLWLRAQEPELPASEDVVPLCHLSLWLFFGSGVSVRCLHSPCVKTCPM